MDALLGASKNFPIFPSKKINVFITPTALFLKNVKHGEKYCFELKYSKKIYIYVLYLRPIFFLLLVDWLCQKGGY